MGSLSGESGVVVWLSYCWWLIATGEGYGWRLKVAGNAGVVGEEVGI